MKLKLNYIAYFAVGLYVLFILGSYAQSLLVTRDFSECAGIEDTVEHNICIESVLEDFNI